MEFSLSTKSARAPGLETFSRWCVWLNLLLAFTIISRSLIGCYSKGRSINLKTRLRESYIWWQCSKSNATSYNEKEEITRYPTAWIWLALCFWRFIIVDSDWLITRLKIYYFSLRFYRGSEITISWAPVWLKTKSTLGSFS